MHLLGAWPTMCGFSDDLHTAMLQALQSGVALPTAFAKVQSETFNVMDVVETSNSKSELQLTGLKRIVLRINTAEKSVMDMTGVPPEFHKAWALLKPLLSSAHEKVEDYVKQVVLLTRQVCINIDSKPFVVSMAFNVYISVLNKTGEEDKETSEAASKLVRDARNTKLAGCLLHLLCNDEGQEDIKKKVHAEVSQYRALYGKGQES
eukprot:2899074-Amphidinium_carterae.1